MTGRHSAPHHGAKSFSKEKLAAVRRSPALWLTELLILMLIVMASFAIAGVVHSLLGGGCEEKTIEVTAAPGVAPALEEAASAWSTSLEAEDVCASVKVTARPSVEVAEELAGPQADPPDLWVPDSSQWVQWVRRETRGVDTPVHSAWVSPPIASSPMVLAATRDDAESLVEAAAGGWSEVLSGKTELAVVDPRTNTEGLLTLATAQATLGSRSGSPTRDLVSSFVELSSRVLTSTSAGMEQSRTRAALPFPTSEQAVILANAGSGPERVQSLYPRGEGMSLDFPVVHFVPPTQEPVHLEAAQAFVSFLHQPVSQRELRATGLRAPNGGAFPTTVEFDGIAATAVIGSLPPATDQQVVEAGRVWSAAQRGNRTLIVVDVSGSMGGGGGEKIRFAAAAAEAAVDYLPDSAQLGLWAFSTDLDGSSPWRELVPLGSVGSPDDPDARRQTLAEKTKQLPSLTETPRDTALYQTTWDAYQTVSEGYDPQRLNSVVLVTDGSDTTSELTRRVLLSRLGEAHDSDRPVPISTVAIGPDADTATLARVSAATGGSQYAVDTASDIREVFLDAVIEAGK
jgi:Ca-activated chloride channel homolog